MIRARLRGRGPESSPSRRAPRACALIIPAHLALHEKLQEDTAVQTLLRQRRVSPGPLASHDIQFRATLFRFAPSQAICFAIRWLFLYSRPPVALPDRGISARVPARHLLGLPASRDYPSGWRGAMARTPATKQVGAEPVVEVWVIAMGQRPGRLDQVRVLAGRQQGALSVDPAGAGSSV